MLIITIIADVLLSLVAANFFASEMEAVSAARATADEDNPKRYLELGKSGRLMLSIPPIVVLVVIALIKRWWIPASIISLVLILGLSIMYMYFRILGFGLFKVWFILHALLSWTAMNRTQFEAENLTTWTLIWSGLITIIFIFTCVAAIILRKYEPEDEEETEEDDDFDEDGIAPVWVTILKGIIIVAVIILVFALGYIGCTHLIIPKFV